MKPTNARLTDQQTPLNFDYQSTTPCEPEVIAAMTPYWKEFWGNASNRQNQAGLHASAALSLAREQVAKFLNVQPERLIFTSGATEANNLALIGHARARALELGKPGHLITVATEHHSVIDPLRQLQREGFTLTEIQPASDGLLPIKNLLDAFQKDTFLVSVMIANNEIGVLQPLDRLTELCRERGITFHSDAAQAFGQISMDIDQVGIDFLTLSGHKIYGPKGIGVLVVRKDISLVPLQFGGRQEQGIRPGTVPIPLVIGFAKAVEIAARDVNARERRFRDLRDKLWYQLIAKTPDLILNGSLQYRLPHNLNFTIPGVKGNDLHRALRPFLYCSSGSACSNGEPSHVLRAIGRSMKEAEASLRLSLGRDTTISDVNKAVDLISTAIKDLR